VKDRPRALAVLIAVFLFGCVVGSTGSYFWLKRAPVLNGRPPEFGDNTARNGHRPRPEQPNFREILQLTDAQDARFKEIIMVFSKQMRDSSKQTDAFHAQQEIKIKTIIDEMHRKLLSILNSEEQKKKFENWQKEFEKGRGRPSHRREFGPSPQ
jgi:hypothetical protein